MLTGLASAGVGLQTKARSIIGAAGVAAGLAGVAALTLLALGGQAAPLGALLHEPLPEGVASAPRSDQIEPGPATPGGDSDLPEAILTAQGRIEKPKTDEPGVPTYQPRPPPRVGLDRRTGADLDLHYQVVFDPAVAPFKREHAFDRVRDDLTLDRSGQGQRALATGQAPRADHELFWGHLRVKLVSGQSVALPSVAPTSRILQWQAVPPQALEFSRDDAGNYSVSGPHDAEVDLRFLMDAPSTYFAAPLGRWRGDDDPERPALSPVLQARAQKLWPALGLGPGQDRAGQLTRLVEYFRSYEPGEPPPSTGDDLADLVLAKKGVCRHRTLAFVVLCHSLGIAAHYVMNDAHAFAEVWAPDASGAGHWLRVDLGGGADSLELHAATGKHLHQPQFGDPFPRPEAYTSQTGQVKIDGVAVPQPLAGARKLKGAEGLAGGALSAEPGGRSPGGADNGSSFASPQDQDGARRLWLQQRAQELAAPRVPPAVARSQASATPRRSATQIVLQPVAAMAWLGEPLHLAGRLISDAGAQRLAVEAWLIDPSHPQQGRLLGVLPTDIEGHFAGDLAIPSDADPQTYDVVVRFPGDPRRAPCDSGP
ncbi:MAG: transglutaminase domain-containing protein [Deltaproteobacteria bacterium]|nr:transglutaminase domain-containing protein [Deltaproteobacteria bacterium]